MDVEFDLIVIGGGINGAGIARDAASRGLRTLLLEAKDFGGGTSSWSSRLIHGGLRYLEYMEVGLVYESLHERRHLLHIAPHLVKPLRLVIPSYQHSKRGRHLVRLGMVAYDFLSLAKSLPSHQSLSKQEMLAEEPSIASDSLSGGVAYYDAQVTFPERLVIENILSAQAAGAQVRNYCTVEKIHVQSGVARAVSFIDQTSGKRERVNAKAIINAAGPWVDRVLTGCETPMEPVMGGTKGSHIVVGKFDGAPSSAFYVEARADGRPIFMIPWNGQYLIGTTDIRYSGDPRQAHASRAEIDYLLREVNHLFPEAALKRKDIHYSYCGVRPLPKSGRGSASAISRRHIIRHHEKQASGLFSIIGGKLTTYRNLARQAVNMAANYLDVVLPESRTARVRLPGARGLRTDVRRPLGNAAAVLEQLSAKHQNQCRSLGIDEARMQRLFSLYGVRVAGLLALVSERPELAKPCGPAIAAELVFAVNEELARSLADVMQRRTMLAFEKDHGLAAARDMLAFAGAHIGWDEARCETEYAAYQAALNIMRVA